MLPSGFNERATAAVPPAGDLYFAGAVAVPNPGELHPPVGNLPAPQLMFSSSRFNSVGEAVTGPAVEPTKTVKGGWREILNFHGSPAPWILLLILLAAGILHLQASGRARVRKAGVEVGGQL